MTNLPKSYKSEEHRARLIDQTKRWQARNPDYLKNYYLKNQDRIKKQAREKYHRQKAEMKIIQEQAEREAVIRKQLIEQYKLQDNSIVDLNKWYEIVKGKICSGESTEKLTNEQRELFWDMLHNKVSSLTIT